MPLKIFYSWQADTPTKVGRNLIERALTTALKAINEEMQLEQPEREGLPEIEIDRDTFGVPGSPPIVETIFNKIDAAAIFVPDLTFVGKRLDGRTTPNPNVLIEYGWALKQLGHGRIVPVMNTSFGKPEDKAMPFNMRHLRHPILYDCPADANEGQIGAAKQALAKILEKAIRAVLGSAEFKESQPKPPAPMLFTPRVSADGKGRFRPPGKRLGVTAGWGRDGKPIHLIDGPAIWLRLMPLHDPSKSWSLADLQQAMSKPSMIPPIHASAGGFGYIRDADGYGTIVNVLGSENETSLVAYLFDTGEIWSIDSWHVEKTASTNSIPLDEKQFAEALSRFDGCLQRLGLERPFHWIAGIEGVEGRGFFLRAGHSPAGSCVSDDVIFQGELKNDQTASDSLEPFFARIYELCGLIDMRTKKGGFND